MSYVLYGYWRSSAAYRVRIGLFLKGVPFESRSVHLLKNGGEQHGAGFMEINPAKLVPVLQTPEGPYLNQSLSILEYLEDLFPQPAFFPTDLIKKALVRSIALTVACDIHPLNNLRVIQFLKTSVGCSDEAKDQWYAHWISEGFQAIESSLEKTMGKFCIGDEVSLADICLIPQVYNARRFNVSLSQYPRIVDIEARCQQLECFDLAKPEVQNDTE